MFKKLKAMIQKRKQLKKQKEYYSLIAKGGLFLKFIQNDLKQMEKRKINRAMRRRFQQEIKKKGKFSEEMINYYLEKIDSILFYVESQEIKRKIANKKK